MRPRKVVRLWRSWWPNPLHGGDGRTARRLLDFDDMAARERGFTLLELLVTMAVVAILTAIALPAYQQYRMRAWDGAARSDLRNAMTAIETAITDTGVPPPSQSHLSLYGHRLSAGVSITRYSVEVKNGMTSAHIHVKHAKSTNSWHAHYPAESSNIEIR